jgi:hypothetical protein
MGRTIIANASTGSKRLRPWRRDSSKPPEVRIFNPDHFFAEVGGPFDLIVNVDSLTELGRQLATQYFERLGEIGDCFLSVTHEANEYRARDLHEGMSAFAR